MIDGKTTLILGKKGYGKSVKMASLVIDNKKFFDKIYIVDSVGEHTFLDDKYQNVFLVDVENFVSEMEEIYNKAKQIYPQQIKTAIFIDEFDKYTSKSEKEILRKLCHYSRKYAVFVFGIVRRPVLMEKSILALADNLIVFRLSHYNDVKHLELQEYYNEIKELKKFEYFLFEI